ncbi:tetratricopeptide repeat protein [Pseudomonas sp. dw_358]|uniref:tetratricopeptide repeat protein n=1 Tax=Pseudomonas sp. dw_358 TaxID=2720083 RepID=UPI001BD65BC2|nr:tetratricopeptide repeat protein [Pseudomonas sp. dw_358]
MIADPVLRLGVRNPTSLARLLLDQAGAGNVEAQARLGQLLLDGHGITKDGALALRWFRIAAAAGHLAAINMTGRCLEQGWGCTADLAGAAACYHRSAVGGLDWGQYNFANLLGQGRGVARDMAQALVWYQRAADQGHAKAMNLVGRFHEEGWEVEQDLDMAFAWFQRSALAGDFRGQCSYAAMLIRRGRGEEAAGWLVKATQTATPAFLVTIREAVKRLPGDGFLRVLAAIDGRLT